MKALPTNQVVFIRPYTDIVCWSPIKNKQPITIRLSTIRNITPRNNKGFEFDAVGFVNNTNWGVHHYELQWSGPCNITRSYAKKARKFILDKMRVMGYIESVYQISKR